LEIVPLPMPELAAQPPVRGRPGGGSGIRLELEQMSISLAADFDAEALRRVLSVLEER
jgi:hypothetical protein